VIPFLRKPADVDPAVYRNMFDQASDGRFVLDATATILHANLAAARLFGAAEAALYLVPFSELLAPTAREEFQHALAAIVRPPSRIGPIALVGRFADGSTFPIEVELVRTTNDRYGVVVRDRRVAAKDPRSAPGRFNPGQVLIASRIQELV
jgi:PAS domain S-box-containing protein